MDSNEHEKNSFINVVVGLKMPEDRVKVKYGR
jgi:hypothetical protein